MKTLQILINFLNKILKPMKYLYNYCHTLTIIYKNKYLIEFHLLKYYNWKLLAKQNEDQDKENFHLFYQQNIMLSLVFLLINKKLI